MLCDGGTNHPPVKVAAEQNDTEIAQGALYDAAEHAARFVTCCSHCRYTAQPLTEEVLVQEQQRAEDMLQAATAGIAPPAQELPQDAPASSAGVCMI